MDLNAPLNRARIEQAAATLQGHVRRTPVLEVDGADVGLEGVTLVFKLEFLQHGGSFKARGALLNLLTRPVPAAGVVAASGGNHGVAVALAARRTGHAATIFVPSVCVRGAAVRRLFRLARPAHWRVAVRRQHGRRPVRGGVNVGRPMPRDAALQDRRTHPK